MKGLLLKDILSLRRQSKILLLLLLFYFVFAISQNDTGFLQGIVALICVMLPISSLSYDEAVKWDRYGLSLPLSRKTVVFSKYLLGFLMDFFGSLAALLLSFLTISLTKTGDAAGLLLTSLVMFCVGLLFLAVIFPLIFQFGPEKGRLLLFAIVLLPIVAAFFLNKLGIRLSGFVWRPAYGYLAPAVVLALLFCSVLISTRIYEKKEF
ncbi:MAG: ABC-2 transporter permease [Oscillospiraceae bacterium]|nr:ABC-2 transporter permease [Oscillospiraceae bacterium]